MIAKAPVPGRSKTRLTPPCTPGEAALLARAALEDTLDALARTPATRRVLALEGSPGTWLPPGFEVVPQPAGGFAERLAAAFAAASGPALLVGMDTPQLTSQLISRCVRPLMDGAHAVIGAAEDGGWWALGLARPNPRIFEGVPMSRPETGARQRERLRELGIRFVELPRLRDVDTIDDARAVAAAAPSTRFAGALDRIESRAALRAA